MRTGKGEGGYWQALLQLLYPEMPRCLLCKHPFLQKDEVVCSPCTLQARAGQPPFCRLCGREWGAEEQAGDRGVAAGKQSDERGSTMESAGRGSAEESARVRDESFAVPPNKSRRKSTCSDCRRRAETFFQKAVCYGPYRGRLRDGILRLKNERRQELAPWVGERMAEAFAAFLFDRGIERLVPVPMAADKLARRGFNQAEELAREVGARVWLPVCLALEWRGAGRSQAAKTRAERLSSMDDHLALNLAAAPDVDGRTVCLIDDVYTTGATANACAKKLLEAGARTVYVLTAAR